MPELTTTVYPRQRKAIVSWTVTGFEVFRNAESVFESDAGAGANINKAGPRHTVLSGGESGIGAVIGLLPCGVWMKVQALDATFPTGVF